jgi:hypothetical protein
LLEVEEEVDDDEDNDVGDDDSDSSIPWDELVGEDEGLFSHLTMPGLVLPDCFACLNAGRG